MADNPKTEEPKMSRAGQQPSFIRRSSLESTATTLPSYSEQEDQPPKYGDSATLKGSNPAVRPKPNEPQPAQSRNPGPPSGFSAAALSSVMATSSSEHDKMHSGRRSKKVDDWNEDPTYNGRLARSSGGSSRKWNYFGVNLDQFGNPFKRSGGS